MGAVRIRHRWGIDRIKHNSGYQRGGESVLPLDLFDRWTSKAVMCGRLLPIRSGSRDSKMLWSIVAMATILTACDAFTAPPIRFEHPEVYGLEFDPFLMKLDENGVLFVQSELVDQTFTLEEHQRVPVELTTSAGDVERIPLYHMTCPVGSPFRGFYCFNFIIWPHDWYDPQGFAVRARALGVIPIRHGSTWSMVILDYRRVAIVARAMRAWPDVWIADMDYPICDSFCDPRRWLTGPIPVTTGVPKPRDGTVQIATGDTVRVRYTNPSGGTFQVELVVP